jgi:hypothetical protein
VKLHRFYRKLTVFIILSLLIMLLAILACGPKPKPSPAPAADNAPYNLKAVAGSHSAELVWQTRRDSKTNIGGYNIYLADSPSSEGELYNSAPYPGDTDGDITRESITIPNLENGHRYYAYIRTLLGNGELSRPTGTVEFMPLDQGRLTITTNHTAEGSGYSFTQGKYTPARDFANDFYIYATEAKAGISSPSRLHSSLRQTYITLNNKKDLTQPLQKGAQYILDTADGGRAILTLVQLTGKAPALEASFNYIYYPPGVKP